MLGGSDIGFDCFDAVVERVEAVVELADEFLGGPLLVEELLKRVRVRAEVGDIALNPVEAGGHAPEVGNVTLEFVEACRDTALSRDATTVVVAHQCLAQHRNVALGGVTPAEFAHDFADHRLAFQSEFASDTAARLDRRWVCTQLLVGVETQRGTLAVVLLLVFANLVVVREGILDERVVACEHDLVAVGRQRRIDFLDCRLGQEPLDTLASGRPDAVHCRVGLVWLELSLEGDSVVLDGPELAPVLRVKAQVLDCDIVWHRVGQCDSRRLLAARRELEGDCRDRELLLLESLDNADPFRGGDEFLVLL